MKKQSALDPRSGVYLLTAQDAEAIIASPGAKNRPVSAGRVRAYAQRMKTGKWKLNGEPIILSLKGELLDGEHRLKAVIQSEKELETVVLFGDFSFHTMGQGAKRTGGDAIALAGDARGGHISLSATVGLCITHDRAMKREGSPYTRSQAHKSKDHWMDIDNSERVAWVKRNPRILDIQTKVQQLIGNDKPFLPKSVITAAWFLIEQSSSQEKAEEFMGPLITGAGLKSGDIRLLLRRTCVNRAINGLRIGGMDGLHHIAKCWANRGMELKLFSVRSTEDFPFIR